ncbi:NAD-dependent epimerase/dehydratase family protein [Algoriphagus sp. A40]|uniref:NAD-dependent epimerase/dehydratase family protein n=1 Tax=Algoriphagus sp. A40 TaxID=1945863 RepID=UPI000986ED41|nr:NAD-dependent epimerase/dehydratase family protein [Algoriphagus sp. A40]OOG72374.1 epimerase [Algoriphagus sp. A40]
MHDSSPHVDSQKLTVAIAGAGGYIGSWFIKRYRDKYNLIGLSRQQVKSNPFPEVEWRQVELYSITSTVEALKGVDVAIYLVHSMNASTRLNQGSFEDTDLLLADNFSRAAAINGVRQIIYLGGLLPDEQEEKLSRHLKSRLEVERTLGSRKSKLTALRASIIVGPGGSSFDMIKNLVRKLPVLMCPKWTESMTQPISLKNTLEILDSCISNPDVFGKVIEIGSPEVMSYRSMLERTSRVMGKKRLVFSVPVFSLGLSKFWVGLFGESPPQLVSPLVESLRHTLIVTPELSFKEKVINYQSFEDSVKDALNSSETPNLPTFFKNKGVKNTVRSIQRMSNPGRNSALWVAKRYNLWLPSYFRFLINGKVNEKGEIGFHLLWGKKPMLQLTLIPDRSEKERQLFYITGGWLVKRFDYGWLEFREVLDSKYIISAIHEFVPRLPWYVYVSTQAKFHVWVMHQFKKYLEKK